MATPTDEIKNLKKLAAEAKAEMDKLVGSSQGLERAAIKAEKSYRDQVKILRDANEQVSELLSNQKLSIDAIMQQEARLKGLTGLQASLVDLDRDRLTLQDKIDGSHAKTHAALNSIASLNQELLSLSSEDIIARQHIEKSISDQLYDLIGMEGVTDEIVENLDRTTTVREIKLVYATLAESMKFGGVDRKQTAKRVVSEGIASKVTASTAPKKEIIAESNELAKRFKKLAGIIK